MGDIHELKADPTPFEDVYSGRKMAEVRLDDRGYKVGDVLHLREHQRSGLVGGKYTGRELRRRITHIQRGYGLPEGVVVLSLESRPTPEQSREARAIPTTPQEMIEFIGSNFDSMQADQWTDEVIPKPAGDLSNVRYSLTVHDLLSAFDWAGLHDAAMDRSALGRENGSEK